MSSTMEIDEDGNKYWRNEKGEFHREDGPTIEWWDGDKEWWINNNPHRIGGPAIERKDGYKAYYVNGEWHRICGPAIECPTGYKQWCVKGKNITRLIRELLFTSPFNEEIHLGILAEYFAERNDFRLLDIVSPYLTEQK